MATHDTIIPNANRSAGEIVSSGFQRLLTVQSTAGISEARLSGVLASPAAIANSANTMSLTLEWSADGTTGWFPLAATSWRGGSFNRDGTTRLPRCTWSSTHVVAGFFRGRCVTNQTYIYAVDLDVT